MNNESLNQSLALGEEWIEVVLDSTKVIAGERVSGEVLVQVLNNENDFKIILKSSGVESVKIVENNGNTIEHSVNVYTLNTVLADVGERGKVQSVFPFAFKVPMYSPSTFHFSGTDPSGNIIQVSVSYSIEAFLLSDCLPPLKKSKILYLHNHSSRQVSAPSFTQSTPLSSCCINKGQSTISISHTEPGQLLTSSQKTFRVSLASALNNSLAGTFGQVAFNLTVQIPGSREFSFSKIFSRAIPDLDSLFELQGSKNEIGLDFEVNLTEVNCGNFVASNEAALFIAVYRIEFYGNYNIGCGLKSASCVGELQVNPDVPVKDEAEVPRKWNPVEHLISNLIIESSNGVPYPQGTLVVSRNK